jgi:hypothetical protein
MAVNVLTFCRFPRRECMAVEGKGMGCVCSVLGYNFIDPSSSPDL